MLTHTRLSLCPSSPAWCAMACLPQRGSRHWAPMHTNPHTCILTYIPIPMHRYTSAHVIHVCTHTHPCTHVQFIRMCMHTTYQHTRTHTNMHAHARTHRCHQSAWCSKQHKLKISCGPLEAPRLGLGPLLHCSQILSPSDTRENLMSVTGVSMP